MKLTHKANQKLRKSRKKTVADADDDMGKKKRKKKGLGEQQLALFGEHLFVIISRHGAESLG